MSAVSTGVGLAIVGTVELIKLANTLASAYVQVSTLAKMNEAEQDATYQKAKADYKALPLPQDIPEPGMEG